MGRISDPDVSAHQDHTIHSKLFSFPLKEYVMNVMHTVQPGMVVDYAGYFILGHYLSHYEISGSWNE